MLLCCVFLKCIYLCHHRLSHRYIWGWMGRAGFPVFTTPASWQPTEHCRRVRQLDQNIKC